MITIYQRVYIYINYVLHELLRSRQFPTVPTCGCTSSWSALKQPLCCTQEKCWMNWFKHEKWWWIARQKLEWISVHHQEMAWLAGKFPSQVWWSFFSTIMWLGRLGNSIRSRSSSVSHFHWLETRFPSAPSPIALPRFQALRDVTNLGTLLGHGLAQNMF